MKTQSIEKIRNFLLKKSIILYIVIMLVMSNIFTLRENPYNLRNFLSLYSLNIRTVKFRFETITYNAFRYGTFYLIL